MKLTNAAIGKLSDRMLAIKIAVALKFSEQWMQRVIAKNKENGPLTTAMAIAIIKEDTGLTEEEILEQETINEG